MQKAEYFTCVYHSVFSVPKDSRLNSTHYLLIKINKKRELQNIAINHSADIDYKYFMKKPVSLSTTDTTLPASDPLRFVKICFFLIKMTVDDQIKILDGKIKQNEHRMT